MRKLKDRIEDNELDLSLNELSEVPVQELAEATKAIYLDLSCNKIAKLPDNFATLTHLVKLDLSKNLLTELPYNFGNLINLQYLDLYGNQLTTLPLSVYRLKALKWLDLKNNPLGPELKPIAGDCLDQKQCQECAVKVVSFMQSIESEIERQKQIKLKEEREKEAVRKKKEEKELEKKRRIKKAERERRKAEARVRKTEEQNEANVKKENEVHRSKHDSTNHVSSTSEEIHKVSGWARFLGFLVFSVLISASAVIGLMCYRIHSNGGDFSADNFLTTYEETKIEVFELVQVWWHAFAQPYFSSLQRTFHEWIRLIIKE